MSHHDELNDIPGTTVFSVGKAREGYPLNMFCMSLMKQENRLAFKSDQQKYLERFAMSTEQRRAVLDRDWNRMIELGGNIYFLAKLAFTDEVSVQQVAAKMAGYAPEEYAAILLQGGRSVEGNRSKSEKQHG